MRRLWALTVTAVLPGCAAAKPEPVASPAAVITERTPETRVVRETVTVRDAELERRVARLELRVLERETQLEDLQTRLDDARDEVVRTMARLQTLASRAEAASAMAEMDVALQSLRSAEGARSLQEIGQATRFQQQSTTEFNKRNYGGALYLANQAKSAINAARARLAGANRAALRSGETQFALPVRLRIASRGNVREGPGTNFPVAFSVEPGAQLTGFSHTEDWVRVSDDAGRAGWVFRSLISRP